jgi:hypothetical protein
MYVYNFDPDSVRRGLRRSRTLRRVSGNFQHNSCGIILFHLFRLVVKSFFGDSAMALSEQWVQRLTALLPWILSLNLAESIAFLFSATSFPR